MATRRSTRLSGELDAGNKVVNGKRKGAACGKDDDVEIGTRKKKQGVSDNVFLDILCGDGRDTNRADDCVFHQGKKCKHPL